MLETLGTSLEVAIPDIQAEGEIEGWPYMVMTRVQGQTLASRWHGLCTQNQVSIVEELGAIMARLHRRLIASLQGLDYGPR